MIIRILPLYLHIYLLVCILNFLFSIDSVCVYLEVTSKFETMFVLKNPEINVFMSNKKVDALGFNELSIWVSKTHARMKLMENKEQRYSVSH